MFLSEWREFPSAPCLAEKKKQQQKTNKKYKILDESSSLDVTEIARVV
jgi:hypothetical protein